LPITVVGVVGLAREVGGDLREEAVLVELVEELVEDHPARAAIPSFGGAVCLRGHSFRTRTINHIPILRQTRQKMSLHRYILQEYRLHWNTATCNRICIEGRHQRVR